METGQWLSIVIVIGFSVLSLMIVFNLCGSCEGFEDGTDKRGPAVLKGRVQAKSDVAYLPHAPVTGMASLPRPTYDPAYPRTLIPQILELKYAMDDLYERELPYIVGGDAAVQLPISQFKGDYASVKAELLFLQANEYSPPNFTVQDVETMGQNVRFLQKAARTITPVTEGFAVSPSTSSSSSPSPSSSSSSSSSPSSSPSSSSSSSPSSSSSSSPSSNTNPISFTELQTLSLKLGIEIGRLTASGTTDPIIKSRVSIFTQMKQTVDSLIAQINAKTLDPTKIPISEADYIAFLPSLGADSAGPGGLLFNSGYSTLSSLFNSYQVGDVTGAQLAETLFNTYADNLAKGLSYNVSLSYTSPNETTKEVAKALYRGEFQNTIDSQTDGFATPDSLCNSTLQSCQAACGDPNDKSFSTCFEKCSKEFTACSQYVAGTGGAASATPKSKSLTLPMIPNLTSFLSSAFSSNPSPVVNDTAPGIEPGFSWKKKVKEMYGAIKRMGLEPGDFGCLEPGTQVSPDFSWRGNAKMICTRSATHYDPGMPEQIGCPPMNWPGWRS